MIFLSLKFDGQAKRMDLFSAHPSALLYKGKVYSSIQFLGFR